MDGRCAYCGADWAHLESSSVGLATFGLKRRYCNIKRNGYTMYFDWDWLLKTKSISNDERERIQIWMGPYNSFKNLSEVKWRLLIKKHGGNIYFANRSAYLNLLYSGELLRGRGTSIWHEFKDNLKFLIEHGAKVEIIETNIMNYFTKTSFKKIEQILISGHEPSLYKPIFSSGLPLINQLQEKNHHLDFENNNNKSFIGNYYICADLFILMNSLPVHMTVDATIKYSFGQSVLIPTINQDSYVVVIDQNIGLDGNICILIRYISPRSDSLKFYYPDIYDEVKYLRLNLMHR